MKYPLRTATGDAGEFFVAYKIARDLGWPCRLFDIDIGIDAQVELLTDDGASTGRFVALQIKATSKEEVNCRYVSARQLKYWRSLELPVFLVLVDLKKEELFLHLIKSKKKHYTRTKAGDYKITFDLANDAFGSPSKVKAILKAASKRRGMKPIKKYLDEVSAATDKLFEDIQGSDECPDPFALIADMEQRNELMALVEKADVASRVSRVGGDKVAICRNNLREALSRLQEAMRHMAVDYADKADIASFLKEDY